MNLQELITALGELFRGGAKFADIEAAFAADPDSLKIWNKVKGIGQSAGHNESKAKVDAAESRAKELETEKAKLEAKVVELEKGKPSDDDAAAPYRKQVDELNASLETMRDELRQRDLDSEWNAVLDLVAGGADDQYTVNRDYFDVIKARFGESLGFSKGKKPALEYKRDGVALSEADGKSPRAQLAEYLREQVPSGFRVVGSESGGGAPSSGGGAGNADSAFFKSMAEAGKAAGKTAAHSDGMRQLVGLGTD